MCFSLKCCVLSVDVLTCIALGNQTSEQSKCDHEDVDKSITVIYVK